MESTPYPDIMQENDDQASPKDLWDMVSGFRYVWDQSMMETEGFEERQTASTSAEKGSVLPEAQRRAGKGNLGAGKYPAAGSEVGGKTTEDEPFVPALVRKSKTPQPAIKSSSSMSKRRKGTLLDEDTPRAEGQRKIAGKLNLGSDSPSPPESPSCPSKGTRVPRSKPAPPSQTAAPSSQTVVSSCQPGAPSHTGAPSY